MAMTRDRKFTGARVEILKSKMSKLHVEQTKQKKEVHMDMSKTMQIVAEVKRIEKLRKKREKYPHQLNVQEIEYLDNIEKIFNEKYDEEMDVK